MLIGSSGVELGSTAGAIGDRLAIGPSGVELGSRQGATSVPLGAVSLGEGLAVAWQATATAITASESQARF
jgi:hypothetical protein